MQNVEKAQSGIKAQSAIGRQGLKTSSGALLGLAPRTIGLPDITLYADAHRAHGGLLVVSAGGQREVRIRQYLGAEQLRELVERLLPLGLERRLQRVKLGQGGRDRLIDCRLVHRVLRRLLLRLCGRRGERRAVDVRRDGVQVADHLVDRSVDEGPLPARPVGQCLQQLGQLLHGRRLRLARDLPLVRGGLAAPAHVHDEPFAALGGHPAALARHRLAERAKGRGGDDRHAVPRKHFAKGRIVADAHGTVAAERAQEPGRG
mmetsp:Transcript_32775/g.89761  ORF Transcript_32775/g.89761 Transcript_32775/m.89761 type:complete len:261 (+) Transcript_32775:86-868(+)